MPDIDLNSLSLDTLKKLQKNVAKAITSFEARQLKEARAVLTAKALELGYSLEELVGGGAKPKNPAAVPKYRHTENEALTWSGRGRKPAWFKEALAAGKSPEEMAIA